MLRQYSRRDLLKTSTCGMGMLALADLCQTNLPLAHGSQEYVSPLAPKIPHHEPKAKRMIFLHMRGGPSHMETYDYKPMLNKKAGEVVRGKNRMIVPQNWKWSQRGESGLWASDLLKHTAEHMDDLCVFSGMHTDIGNHTPAMLLLHTGSFTFTRPSMGSWIMYGLGSENQNLPGFVSLCPPVINGGSKNYGSAFLPAVYQGTAVGNIKINVKDAQIGNITNLNLSREQQRKQLDLIQSFNKSFAASDPSDNEVDGVIESFELGFRMQNELPDIMDLSDETSETFQLYGIGDGKPSDSFGRQCLLARRLIESGVRHVEVCDEFWDQHGTLKKGHEARAAATDQPTGGLLADLKRRGLLEDTLVVWGGEFGRTPDTQKKDLDGRDHNPKGYTMWMAGGGVKGGMKYGATDEFGYEAVEDRTHLHDFHATILHLMGLDHMKLTYKYAGRDFRLTDVYGRVVNEVIA